MNTHELLIAARKKIERPEWWTKGVEARNADQSKCTPLSIFAACWCGYGALRAVAPCGWIKAADALDAACGDRFPDWQDAPERTHADVLKVFDIAIENTRGEG